MVGFEHLAEQGHPPKPNTKDDAAKAEAATAPNDSQDPTAWSLSSRTPTLVSASAVNASLMAPLEVLAGKAHPQRLGVDPCREPSNFNNFTASYPCREMQRLLSGYA